MGQRRMSLLRLSGREGDDNQTDRLYDSQRERKFNILI
jgi:hypothetical protein